jgi:hypothetical protein
MSFETIGIQEMVRRIEKPDVDKEIGRNIKEMLDHKYFDYNEANIYGTGFVQKEEGVKPLDPADAALIASSVKNVPLREFLARSGTTGIAGAAYLIPTKIHSVLYTPAIAADIVPQISMAVLPPEQLPGTTVKVDIVQDGSFRCWTVSSGATMPTETLGTTQATLDFSQIHGINLRIGSDLIEDAQWDLVERHISEAGRVCGEKASDLAVDIMAVSTDGDGTLNTEGASANETKMEDIVGAYQSNLADKFVPDTYLCSRHAWFHSIMTDATYAAYANQWHDAIIATNQEQLKVFGCNVIFNECGGLTESVATGTAYEDLDSFLFKKDSALLTGRKRWLRIENYSEPIKDLVGATVTFRQDSVSVYNDSICRIRET